MTLPQAALTALLYRYLAGFMDPFLSIEVAQALGWFLQVASEPLPLHFSPTGPRSPTIGDLLGPVLVPHADFLTNQEKSLAETPLALKPGAWEEARAILARHPEAAARVERVGVLIEGFESPSGLELLARAHWSATRDTTARDVRDPQTDRGTRPPFTEHQVSIARTHLHSHGWLNEARHDH